MARVSWPPAGKLILDAGGILALAHGDPRARQVLLASSQRGYQVVLPAVVLAQVHRPGPRNAPVDRVVKTIGSPASADETLARSAGALLGKTSTADVVDALVAAHALASLPALVLTSDPNDLRLLVAADPNHARVSVVGV